MSDNKTVDSIHKSMLDNVSGRYQKTEGFPVWDILRGMAHGLHDMWVKIFDVERKQDVYNLTGSDLERYVYQRKALTRKTATYSVGSVLVTGEGTIYSGVVFSTRGGVQFEALEDITVSGSAEVPVRCLTAGAAGNVPAGAICEMPITLQGIVTINNPEATTDGYEAETDDSLRERYLEALQEPATSGNVYHYKRWAREVAGVGEVKVFPLWQGNNTVQVVIVDDNAQVPDQELVDRVQAYIDPEAAGTGAGQAPVGAYCTVTPAEALPINVSVSLILDNTRAIEDIKPEISEAITRYLAEVALQTDAISPAKIGNIILNCAGVVDYDNLTVNLSNNRIEVPPKCVAVLGGVDVSVI